MRATEDQRVITLFSGERIAPGCRGRNNSPQITTKVGCRIAIAFAAALIGFASAASAITLRNSPQPERSITAGANFTSGVAGSVGFEAALY
jgi:hypothetical protein